MVRRTSLTGAFFLFLTLPLHAVITGRVLDEDGKPLRGARIRVRPTEPGDRAFARLLSSDPQPQWLNTVETNDNGAFRVDTKSTPVVDLMIDAPGREFYEQDFADGDDAGTLTLKKSAASRGRVTANGKGVAGAVVVTGVSNITRTDADGFYETQRPDLDKVFGRITVIHPDYAVVDRPLRDRDGKALSFDVAMKTGFPIRGRVVDPAGRAVAGATVRCYSCAPVRSGEDGSFEIAHAPVEKPPLYAREGNRAGVVFTEGVKPPFAIQLRPAATLSGTVRSIKDESPVAGARVTARMDFSDPFAPSAITDAKGNFTIEGLDGSTRRITAVHPNFFGTNEQRFEPGTRTSRIVYVTPYARLVGRVVDDDQKPVAAAKVRYAFSGSVVMTAPDGTFSLHFPPDRGSQVSVQKEAFSIGTFGPYSLAPGETKSVQYKLSRGLRFEVRLIDRDGAPIANEPVALISRTDTARFPRTTVPCGTSESQCRSDDQGRVVWRVNEGLHDILAGGDKTVRVQLPNQTLNAQSSPMTITLDRGVTVDGRLVWSDGTPANLQALVMTIPPPDMSAPVTDGVFTLRVPAGKLTIVAEALEPSNARSEPVEVVAPATGVTLKLPRYGRIEGRVNDRENDKAVTEFSISILQKDTRPRPMPSKQFRVSDGRFAFDDLAPGTWELRVQAYGFSRANATTVTVEEAKTANAAIQLDRGARLVGRATSEGRPLADVEISASMNSDWRSRPSPVKTDANGEYTIDGIVPGAQRFDARRSGYVTKSIDVTLQAGQETRGDVDLSRGREVRGRVVDSTGRPLPQTSIVVQGSRDFIGDLVSDTDGAFKLTGLGDTTVSISARKDGFVEQKVDVNPATTGDITITLDRGGTITGHVIGVEPSDLPFIEVRASYASETQVDSRGAFTITGVRDGEQVVMATLNRTRRRELQTRVTVSGGIAPPVELDFNAGIPVHGKVTQRGQIVEGSIMFMPAAPGTGAQIASGGIARDGTYEVRVNAPGEYRVQVSRFGSGSIDTGSVSVAGETTHDIELRGASLSGTVIDAVTRQPIANASVVMMPGTEVRTNGAGKFMFDLVVDGKYRIRAQTWSHAPDLRTIEVANGVAPELEIALVRGVEARFRLVDSVSGQLVEPPFMAVVDASHMSVYGGQTPPADSSGVRSILLQPGTYQMMCGGPGGMYKPVTLTVPSPLLDVKLEPQKR